MDKLIIKKVYLTYNEKVYDKLIQIMQNLFCFYNINKYILSK